MSRKPWDGRFTEATDAFVESFTASIAFDRRLAAHDIAGSIAHATMLCQVGVLSETELEQIKSGLDEIGSEITAGKFAWQVSLEDVHMNIEHALTERIGEVGKKLHTGRSRNDQVATDLRLFLRGQIDAVLEGIRALQSGIVELAEAHTETVMPGLTHLQVAQPVSFAHHLMAWFEMASRDQERFTELRGRVNVMPLGAAALAGTTYPIDQRITAELLGFERIAQNSLDAVSDRDFAIEFCAAASILMMHLSRQAEEIVIWSSPQFGFVTLPDRYCTGSSIMPQKKNPDVPELVRGKSGRVFGSLMGLLTVMKGQPLAYNKDNQEDKEPLFDTAQTVLDCLTAFADLVPAMQPHPEAMREAARQGFATATDLTDYLVNKGLPFRDAHDAVGKLVGVALAKGSDLADLTLAEMQEASDLIDKDVFEALTLEGSLAARDHTGGTSPRQVRLAIEQARQRLGEQP